MYRLLWVLLVLCAASGRNPYQILGVPQSASPTKIKKAYRALSRELHPDRNRDDPRAAEKFMDANWAYEVLTNETLKTAYDRGGEEAVKMVESGRGRPGAGGFPGGFAGAKGFPFPGGGFFFPGGPSFGGFGGAPFGGGFGGGAARRGLTRIDWFENSPVDFITGAAAKLNDMTPNWPDVFLLLRKDDDKTELMAKEYVAVAEGWDQWFNFRAVDCRQPQRIPLCQIGMHTTKPFEVLLAFEGTESKRPTVAYSTPQYMSASKLQDWISQRAPTIPKAASSQRALPPAGAAPTVLILCADDADVPMKVRLWVSEQKSRASFVLAKGQRFKEQVLEVVAQVPEAGSGAALGKWSALAVLVTDPSYMVAENVEWLDLMGNSEFVIDWRLTKWIYDKKTGREVFGRAAAVMKPLESGACGPTAAHWCVIYAGPRGHALEAALQRAFAAAPLRGAALLRAEGGAAWRAAAAACGLRAGAPAVVAVKGRRGKYVPFSGAPAALPAWLERLADSAILLHEGRPLQQPLLF